MSGTSHGLGDVRRLAALFRPHRRAALLAALAMAGVAIFTTLVAYLFGPLFDQVLAPDAPRRRPLRRRERGTGTATALKTLTGKEGVKQTAVIRWIDARFEELFGALGVAKERRGLALLLALFAAFLGKNLCAYVAESRFNTVGHAFVRDLRGTLYERLLHQSGSFFASHPSGDLISRVTGDVDRIQVLFGTDLADLVQSLATLAGLGVLVVSRSPELTLVALLIAPAIVVPVVLIANRLRKISKAGRERMGDLTGVLSETIRGQRVVQAYEAEPYEAQRFADVNERTFRLSRRGVQVMAFASPLIESASVLAFCVLLAYAASRISANRMTLGAFISFGVGLVLMYQPFKRATRINLALQTALASARRLFEILDAPNEIADAPAARKLPPFSREIRFAGVSFAYPGDAPVLHGIDLAVPKGSVTALVGPSGAGKTTLANLVPRFMDVVAGSVSAGRARRPERHALVPSGLRSASSPRTSSSSTTRSAGTSPMEGRMSPRRGSAPPSRRRTRSRFVDALPDGLDTRVGESGMRLSGGQRQRLAIARALLKDPPILILDEATSALDTESERAVQQALERLMAGRTVLVIAHRLSTVRRADQLVVLQAGRIVERGRHAELLAAGGLYRRLHDLQAFEPEPSVEVLP